MTPRDMIAAAKQAVADGDLLLARDRYIDLTRRMPANKDAARTLRKIEKQLSGSRVPLTEEDCRELEALVDARDKRADKVLRTLLARHPALPFLHLQRAKLVAQTRGGMAARAYYDRLIEIGPQDTDAHRARALALFELGCHVAALAALEPAFDLAPKFADLHRDKARILLAMGNGPAAEAAIEAAKKLENDPDNFVLEADILASQGRRDAARDILDQGLKAFPEHAVICLERLRLSAGAPPAAVLRQAKAIAGDETQPVLARIVYCFALGDHFHALGETDSAAEHYATGNALRAALTPYDPKAAELALRQAQGRMPASDRFEGPRMVFVVGMNRSATSLVEQILDAHDSVFGLGELDLIDQIAKGLSAPWHKVDDTEIAKARALYAAEVSARSDSDVLVDKMPANFHHLGLIHRMFPDAKVIWMDRDAREVCFSNWKSVYGSEGAAYAYDQEDLAHYYRLHLDWRAMWQPMLGDALRIQNYEALVQDPEAELRALLAWLELTWDDKVLSFHESGRVVRTLSQGQVHRALNTGSIQSYVPYSDHIRPLLDALGTQS